VGDMMMASAVGATYGDALAAGVAAYERLGYRGEWEHHYQGGPIGYHIRELAPGPPAAPNADSAVIVRRHQAVAWNPTVQGTKSEDTFLVTDGAPHVLTASASWPVLDVEAAGVTLQRPSTLER
jgi:hypothetical protein